MESHVRVSMGLSTVVFSGKKVFLAIPLILLCVMLLCVTEASWASDAMRPEWQVGQVPPVRQDQVSPSDLRVIAPPPAPAELSLEDAIRFALQQNLGFRGTLQGLLTARSSWSVARQRWALDLFGRVERRGNDETTDDSLAGAAFSYAAISGADFAVVTELDRLDSDETEETISAVVRQPLLAGRGAASGAYEEVRQARSAYRAALLGFFIDRQYLIEEIISAYFSTVEQQQLVAIQESSVERGKQAVEDAQLRLEAGLIPEIDLRRAQLRLSREETAAVSQRQGLRDGVDRLLLLLGLQVGTMPELVTAVPYEPESLDGEVLVAQALELRPDLRLADIDLEDREAAVRITRSQRLPALDLFGGWSRQRNGVEEGSWNMGLDLSLPIGSRSLTERARRARWALLVTEQARQDVEQQVIADVRRQVRAAEAARSNVEIASASVELSQRSMEIARRMVEEGLATNRDLLDAQDDLRQSESSLASSKISYHLALVRLRVAIGLDITPEMAWEQAPGVSEGIAEPEPGSAE